MDRNEMTDESTMIQKKLLFHARLRSILAALFIVPALALLFFGVKSARDTDDRLAVISEQLEAVEEFDGIRSDVRRIAELSASLNASTSKLLTEVDPSALSEIVDSLKEALSGVSEAAKNVAELDPDAVNALLRKLDGELDGLSGALDNIAKLDPDNINNLLSRLDDVMSTLDKLSGVLEKLSSFRLFG